MPPPPVNNPFWWLSDSSASNEIYRVPLKTMPPLESRRSEGIVVPSCTVVVCTRQRPQALRRCLHALRRLRYPQLHILVIENAGKPGEAQGIADSFEAKYRICTRRGLSAARNLGVASVSTDLVAFIDDDAVCEPDWLMNAAPLFQDQQVLAVTGKILFHDDEDCFSRSVRVFDPGVRVVDRTTADWFGMTNFGGLGLGSNFIVRRTAFQQVGRFDERLGRGTRIHGSEENLFLFRIIDAGYKVATCPMAVVHHPAAGCETPEETVKSIAASTAIASLLAFEYPSYFVALFEYLWGAVLRRPQPWRERPANFFEGMTASRWTVYKALALGPFIYLASTLRHVIEGTPELSQDDSAAAPGTVEPISEETPAHISTKAVG